MDNETLLRNKLILMYILDRVNFPIDNAQLSKYLLLQPNTNPIDIQENINELLDDGYIRADRSNTGYTYKITDTGRETISLFQSSFPVTLRDDLDLYLDQNNYSLREENSYITEYYENKNDEYIVHLGVIERTTTLIELTFVTHGKDQAENICRRWKEKSSDIYKYVIQTLCGPEGS
jgi:predicted transcriptional regulator